MRVGIFFALRDPVHEVMIWLETDPRSWIVASFTETKRIHGLRRPQFLRECRKAVVT
jgi:hypothetical protein